MLLGGYDCRRLTVSPVKVKDDVFSSEGLPGVLGNKGTLAKSRTRNISQFLGTGNKISKNYST